MPNCWPAIIAERWLAWRNLEVLYRGQGELHGEDFLSDIASGEVFFRGATGMDASLELVRELQHHNIPPHEMRAWYHRDPVFAPGTPPEFWGEPLGAAGIPFSRRLPVAAAYARNDGEYVYVTLQEIGQSLPARGHGYVWESEQVALHRVSHQTIVLRFIVFPLPAYDPAGS
jgi:hypothetical protein